MPGLIEQPNRAVERGGTRVHVPLRRGQVLMPGQLLDRPRRRATHRQVRTERVTDHVRPVVEHARAIPEESGLVAGVERPGGLRSRRLSTLI